MSAEQRELTASAPQETSVEDSIRREQERLLQEVTACGEELFSKIQTLGITSAKNGGIEFRTGITPYGVPPWWFATFSFPKEGEEQAPRRINWQAETSQVKQGLLTRVRVPNWRSLRVELIDFPERGLDQLTFSRLSEDDWEIRTVEKYPLKPPMKIREGELPSVDQRIFCTGNHDYPFPLSISRGIGDFRLPMLSVIYAKGDGPILIPCDASLNLNIDPHLRFKEELLPFAAIEGEIDSRLKESKKFLSHLWKTFPEEVDFTRILGDYRDLIVESTNQAFGMIS